MVRTLNVFMWISTQTHHSPGVFSHLLLLLLRLLFTRRCTPIRNAPLLWFRMHSNRLRYVLVQLCLSSTTYFVVRSAVASPLRRFHSFIHRSYARNNSDLYLETRQFYPFVNILLFKFGLRFGNLLCPIFIWRCSFPFDYGRLRLQYVLPSDRNMEWVPVAVYVCI